MVSTRGPKYKFTEGEKVLCYEPDPTKAKVLYDSKVLGTYETKDKRGRKITQYKIHFQGWSSTWDRKVNSDFVLKDTEENRQLQKDLAEKAQLQLGAYLYRKERKKRARKEDESDSSPKTRHRGSSEDNFSSGSTLEKHEGDFLMRDECETESCSSSVESFHDDERVLLKVSERLKQYLEYDYEMTVRNGKQHILPARIPVLGILEIFVKQSAVKLVFSASQNESSRRRNTNLRPDKKEREFEKIVNTVSILKEVADGLRIYFDFTLADNLLYKEEKEYAISLLSEENLKNFSYVPSPGLSPDFLSPKPDYDTPLATAESSQESSQTPTMERDAAGTSEEPQKRKLRSHRSEDCDAVLENCLSSIASTSSGGSTPLQATAATSSLNYLKSLQPMTLSIPPQAKDFLQKVLSWQILPSNADPAPSMIFGATHLARLIVKLPEFLNATTITEEKLKLLLQHLDSFVHYLESRKEWFGEHNYFKEPKVEVVEKTPTDEPKVEGTTTTAAVAKT